MNSSKITAAAKQAAYVFNKTRSIDNSLYAERYREASFGMFCLFYWPDLAETVRNGGATMPVYRVAWAALGYVVMYNENIGRLHGLCNAICDKTRVLQPI